MRLEEHQLRGLEPALVRELHAAQAVLHREAMPDDPAPPVEQLLGKAANMPTVYEAAVIFARDGSADVAGYAVVALMDMDGYRHLAQVTLGVLPEHRRAGLGRQLLTRAVEIAAEREKTILVGDSRQNVPAGEAFARAAGAELAQIMRENRLDLEKVDRDLLERWLEEGRRRAPGYSLSYVRGVTPPELAQSVVEVWSVMNTAPRDDLEIGDLKLTPELLSEMERTSQAAGIERWAYYAVEDATGRFVGLTDVHVAAAQPTHVHVGNTGVEPAHRGHALGKWLKAAITLKVMAEIPEARFLITANAASNDAMLGINTAMGFRPAAALQKWQVSTERARERLRSL